MAEYEHGSMDTTEQERTFVGFLKIAALVVVHIILILIFLAFVGT
ncbi:MAG TPA: aa3-type cytochrome c oxidase subunit IV [Thermohalobaculum sp.]|nr:aa3-type cytochrome c oxidase subunit IV [Thermohalobaculum sp.]